MNSTRFLKHRFIACILAIAGVLLPSLQIYSQEAEAQAVSDVRRKRYVGMLEMGLNFPIDGHRTRGMFATSHGKQVSDRWYVGGGFGCQVNGINYTSFFVDNRVFINKHKHRIDPFVQFRLGAGFNSEDRYIDVEDPYTHDIYQEKHGLTGLYVNPIVGVNIPFGRHNWAVALAAAYSGILSAHETVDAVHVKIGIVF